MKAKIILSRRHNYTLTSFLCFTVLFVNAYGQSREQKVFNAIPEQLRARLIERLNLYIEYQTTRQYDKLYDLLSESAITQYYRGQSKAEFINAYQKADAQGRGTRLIEFSPTETAMSVRDNINIYDIYGKAKLCEEREVIKKRIVIQALMQNGDWRFSPIGDVLVD